ncbi:hypothetical protein [Pseudonocardia sp. ICBG601]|uniref:hypothetical protein n=1 Tax=Pseudonocardia sp. ICBG601 TaxID=2846759 RepID=UPI001CF607DB|nr:hypothetical protein [Pseudonocardia sp. ICBG601]
MVGDRVDHRQVVLDEQLGESLGPERHQQLPDLVGLRPAHARCGLVEQQDRRVRRQ